MTGAHRKVDEDPRGPMVKTVRWLLALVALIAGTVGVVGIPVYLIVTDSRFLPIATMALQGIVCLTLGTQLVLKVLRDRAPSPVILADWTGDSFLVIGWLVTVLANIGESRGWMHGAFEYAVVGILGLFAVGMPVYWWRGQQRVVLALTARAVAGRWPWSASDPVM